MARDVRNVAASVRARLKNLALANRASFERVLTRYARRLCPVTRACSLERARLLMTPSLAHLPEQECGTPSGTTRIC